MPQEPRLLGIITARGGSKALPRKNVLDLCGKPVIAYTVEAALGSRSLDRVIVSTDSEEIADISREFGADVPFLRPPELATDDVPHVPVLRHAITYLEEQDNYAVGAVVLLQPTSPLRTAEHIDAAVELFLRSGADSVVSVAPTIYIVEEDTDGALHPVSRSRVGHFHRTDSDNLYDLNGAIYVIRRDEIMARDRILGDRALPYVMNRMDSIEIDDRDDLSLVDLILRSRRP